MYILVQKRTWNNIILNARVCKIAGLYIISENTEIKCYCEISKMQIPQYIIWKNQNNVLCIDVFQENAMWRNELGN